MIMKWQKFAYNKITTKTSAIFILLFFLFLSTHTFALGIGGIKLNSTLDQPLDANIELLGVSSDELPEIEIKLASIAIYERMGIERNTLIEQLVFKVQEQDDGKHVIHISTNRSVTEPFLNFLIEVNWRNGRLLREFTVLLDPPVLLEEEAAPVDAPETELPPSFSVTTQTDEEAETLAPMVEAPKAEEAVEETEEFVEAESAEEEVAEENESSPAMDSSREGTSTSSNSSGTLATEYTVQKNDQLWKIAQDLRPQNVSVEQMMLALQRENPEAFFGDTVSQLKAGAVLRVNDTSALDMVTVSEAITEITRQHHEWLAYKRERQARNAVAADSADTQITEEESFGSDSSEFIADIPEEDSSLLKLVSPIDEQADSAQTNAALEAGESELASLNVELSMASEDIEAKRRENEDLRTRLAALQDQMNKAKNLIELKDNELNQFDTGVEDETISQILPSVELDVESELSTTADVAPPVTPEFDEPEQETAPNLWEDPITIGTAAGVGLLLLLIVMVMRRKRKEAQDEYESEAIDYEDNSLEELFADPEKSNDETQIIKFNDSYTDTEKEESDVSLEPLTELNFESNENELLENKEPLLDPIAEADVYLTYEKYDKAEVLLNDAIQAEPGRQELKLKLLEVYALSHNVDAFNNAAEILYASVSGDDQNPIWQQAIVLALEIGSGSPLFSSSQSAATELAEEALRDDDADLSFDESDFLLDEKYPPFDSKEANKASDSETKAETFSKPVKKLDELTENDLLESFSSTSDFSADELKVSEESLAELDELSFDALDNNEVLEFTDLDEIELTNETTDSPLSFDEAKVEPQAEDSLSFDDLEFDFGDEKDDKQDKLPEKLQEPKSTVETGESKVAPDAKDTVVDEIIGNLQFPEDEQAITVDDIFDPVSNPVSEALNDDKDFSDTSLFLLSDEVGTKLDLAKAYMEMGDHDGAKDLLSEVMGEGNSKQKAEAKELLELT